MRLFNQHNRGSVLPVILTVSAIGIILIAAVADLSLTNLRLGNSYSRKSTSREIAEAGINYYQWHLAHNNKDYRDGQTTPTDPPYGPYVHEYKNTDGEVVGTYALTITPPNLSSPYAIVSSLGKAKEDNNGVTIEARIGIPSFAQFAYVTNDQLNFGVGAITNGKIHSNDGIRFDGIANDIVTSAKKTYHYNCSSYSNYPGVWGDGTFNKGYQFPVPAIDFAQITANLQDIKTEAQKSDGVYLAASGASGYRLLLRSNPDQIDIYKVTSASKSGISTTFLKTVNYPTNGAFFAEDNVYISGIFNGKMTIAAAKLPDPGSKTTRKNIIIIDDIFYNNNTYDGSILLGLIAQNDVKIAHFIHANVTIDGAILAQNGGLGYDFSSSFTKNDLGKLTMHGGIASDLGACGGYGMVRTLFNQVEGFSSREYDYDQNLYFGPPPMYPTTGSYTVLSWREK